jgi:hydrogenase nickel insertion protein HypA
MHEASLAQSIVNTVLGYAGANRAAEVKSVQIDLGELTFFSREQLSFWIRIGFEKTIASKAKIIFNSIRGRLSCSDCGYEGEITMHEDAIYHFATPDFSCPGCRGGRVSISQGREAVVRSIRIILLPSAGIGKPSPSKKNPAAGSRRKRPGSRLKEKGGTVS